MKQNKKTHIFKDAWNILALIIQISLIKRLVNSIGVCMPTLDSIEGPLF